MAIGSECETRRRLPERPTGSGPCSSFGSEVNSVVTSMRADRDDEDLVRLYLRDIGQYPLLCKQDEARLAQAIEARACARQELAANADELSGAQLRALRRQIKFGDDAERTFVQSNLRLVVHIAKKYQASGLPLL